MTNKKVLEVPAVADIADPSKTQWAAYAFGPAQGLFAYGPDFKAAREGLASVVAEAVLGGGVVIDGLDPEELGAVRILATTRKTYPIDDMNLEHTAS